MKLSLLLLEQSWRWTLLLDLFLLSMGLGQAGV